MLSRVVLHTHYLCTYQRVTYVYACVLRAGVLARAGGRDGWARRPVLHVHAPAGGALPLALRERAAGVRRCYLGGTTCFAAEQACAACSWRTC